MIIEPDLSVVEKVTQFHHISLCNVVYKIISKMLSNRLKIILPEIISENQSAFVPGRLINDNIVMGDKNYHMEPPITLNV